MLKTKRRLVDESLDRGRPETIKRSGKKLGVELNPEHKSHIDVRVSPRLIRRREVEES